MPVFILVTGCNNRQANTLSIPKKNMLLVQEATLMLEDAMLVTRSDDDFESLALMNMQQQERLYSHAGIVFKEEDSFYVYHIMTGNENPSGKCRKDPFDSFVNPLQKTGFGLHRYNFTPAEKKQLHQWYKNTYTHSPPFDIYFNLAGSDSLYCTEIIYKGIAAATNNRVQLPVSVIENFKPKMMGYDFSKVFFKRFEYVGIDNLYLNPFCTTIKTVKYQ
ncbi:MAG TPA: YiiX/YebB-like N1pC/P60 family cysteine hydrolase [Ferruginibacter sp.]|nr:YiiX/YebB-like N1pC/P60 family cysteine hydrolase [Ferruginibacter sp.]HMP20252.1 YiiX/YebB-like N1pC/P60 family cysteine hydrolase [Ferruginibacter sp.]